MRRRCGRPRNAVLAGRRVLRSLARPLRADTGSVLTACIAIPHASFSRVLTSREGVPMSRSQGYPYFGIGFPSFGRLTYHPPMDHSPESEAKRVLIADDHPLYRDALRAIVPQAMPNAKMSEAGCQKEVVDNVTSDSSFDLIVLDLNLPGATGLSCLRHLREVAQLTPIMVVSGNDDPATMRDVVMAGATGYVPKSAPRQVLIDAIRVIMGGGTYLPTAAVLALRR